MSVSDERNNRVNEYEQETSWDSLDDKPYKISSYLDNDNTKVRRYGFTPNITPEDIRAAESNPIPVETGVLEYSYGNEAQVYVTEYSDGKIGLDNHGISVYHGGTGGGPSEPQFVRAAVAEMPLDRMLISAQGDATKNSLFPAQLVLGMNTEGDTNYGAGSKVGWDKMPDSFGMTKEYENYIKGVPNYTTMGYSAGGMAATAEAREVAKIYAGMLNDENTSQNPPQLNLILLDSANGSDKMSFLSEPNLGGLSDDDLKNFADIGANIIFSEKGGEWDIYQESHDNWDGHPFVEIQRIADAGVNTIVFVDPGKGYAGDDNYDHASQRADGMFFLGLAQGGKQYFDRLLDMGYKIVAPDPDTKILTEMKFSDSIERNNFMDKYLADFDPISTTYEFIKDNVQQIRSKLDGVDSINSILNLDASNGSSTFSKTNDNLSSIQNKCNSLLNKTDIFCRNTLSAAYSWKELDENLVKVITEAKVITDKDIRKENNGSEKYKTVLKINLSDIDIKHIRMEKQAIERLQSPKGPVRSFLSGMVDKITGTKGTIDDFILSGYSKLAGKSWNKIISAFEEYSKEYQQQMQEIQELDEKIVECCDRLLKYFEDIDSMDTRDLPAIQRDINTCKTQIAELSAQIASIPDYEQIDVCDEKGNVIESYVIDHTAEKAALQAQVDELSQVLEEITILYNKVSSLPGVDYQISQLLY